MDTSKGSKMQIPLVPKEERQPWMTGWRQLMTTKPILPPGYIECLTIHMWKLIRSIGVSIYQDQILLDKSPE